MKISKKELEKQIQESIAHINSIQKMAIDPHEEKITELLMDLFPKITRLQAKDWMLDVVYNDPENTLKRMQEIFS